MYFGVWADSWSLLKVESLSSAIIANPAANLEQNKKNLKKIQVSCQTEDCTLVIPAPFSVLKTVRHLLLTMQETNGSVWGIAHYATGAFQ